MEYQRLDNRVSVHALLPACGGAGCSVLLLLLLLAPCLATPAYALGFGSLKLHSHLHQALYADVPLVLSAGDDIDQVRIELAGASEYRQLGLQRQAVLMQLSVALQGKGSAVPMVVLRTGTPVDNPMLSIVLKFSKAGRGTYYKHFKVLLDPAESAADPHNRPQTMAVHDVAQGSNAQGFSTQDSGAANDWARQWRYGPVRAGDSLSEIAFQLRKDKRFSNRQVMLSLYEKNPHAFTGADINRLKKGVWLDVPDAAAVKHDGSVAAMHKLSRLLKPQRPAPVQPVVVPESNSKSKLTHAAAAAAHYSGKVSLQQGDSLALVDALKVDVNKQFDAMHADMMDDKLQLRDLNASVLSLNKSVHGMQADISDIKKDIASIRGAGDAAGMGQNWLMLLLALLAGLLGGVLASVMRKKNSQKSDAVAAKLVEKAPVKAAEKTTGQVGVKALSPQADEVNQLLNQAEEHLGQCAFDEAEQILARVEEKTPGSLRAAALMAQLYHETERHQQRNELINRISESADKKRWERFCALLPSQVWSACFGDGSAD